MIDREQAAVARYLRRLASLPGVDALTDAQLLEQFVARREAAAFEVLVWRHGPKVLGICRRVLRHEQDAEDAFQATFLVLVRKAAAIGRRQAVGPWLARVAYRLALRAKVLSDKRTTREHRPGDGPIDFPSRELLWRNVRPILDEEINRLPAKYREPFILCYVDGKTNEEAARELGCPKGTVLSRLAWARERLRQRLTGRGLTLSVGLLAAAITGNAADAGIPGALVHSTLKAALLVAAGRSVGEVASAAVAGLTKGALQSMLWRKLTLVACSVLVCSALGVGGVLALQPGGSRLTSEAAATAKETKAEPPGKKEEPPKADKPESPKPDKPEPPKPDKPEAPKPDKPTRPFDEPKMYEFDMRDQPWNKVFEWYSSVSGLPFAGSEKPEGTCTIIGPMRKKYTIVELTDILSETLLPKGYILIIRDASFTVLPADQKIDPTFVPRVHLDELGKRRKYELVSLVLPLTNLNAKEIASAVKKMGGPFNDVIVLEPTNELILQDVTGNLRTTCKTIMDMDDRAGAKKKGP